MKARLRWISFILIAILLIASFLVYRRVTPKDVVATGSWITLHLRGGPLACPFFAPNLAESKVLGLVVLGTGDGGWSYWEENTAKSLSSHGYVVVGYDCRKFSDTRSYDHQDLADCFNKAVQAGLEKCNLRQIPVWYSGWSTGADQSVAAAASPDRPKTLVGLLLAAPGSRGRFGITTSDLLGITPTGEGTYALSDFADQLKGLRIAQFVAGLDPLDDTTWLDQLDTPTKKYYLPNSLHDMGGAGEEFQKLLLEAILWTLNKQP